MVSEHCLFHDLLHDLLGQLFGGLFGHDLGDLFRHFLDDRIFGDGLELGLVLGGDVVEHVLSRICAHSCLLGCRLSFLALSLDGLGDVFFVAARECFFCL